jgi:membrane protein implicated in regulation of membrane protease activity
VLDIGWPEAIVLLLVTLAIVWLLRRVVAALQRPPDRGRKARADESRAADVLDQDKRPRRGRT